MLTRWPSWAPSPDAPHTLSASSRLRAPQQHRLAAATLVALVGGAAASLVVLVALVVRPLGGLAALLLRAGAHRDGIAASLGGIASAASRVVARWGGVSLAFLGGLVAAYVLLRSDASQRFRRAYRARAAARLGTDARSAVELLRVLGLGDALRLVPAFLIDAHEGFERVSWLNQALERVWPVVRRAADEYTAEDLAPLLEPYFEAYKPPQLRRLRLVDYSPGSRAPSLAGVKVEDLLPGDASTGSTGSADELDVMLDLRLVSDMKLTIEAVGPGGIGVTMTVSDIQVFGKLRLRLAQLLPAPPYVGAMATSFMAPPWVDMGLKVSGARIPGLESAVRAIVAIALDDLMVHPRQLIVPLAPNADISALQRRPSGIVYVRLLGVDDIPDVERLGLPDPYVKVYTREMHPSFTSIKANTLSPVWAAPSGSARSQSQKAADSPEEDAGDDNQIMQFVVEDPVRDKLKVEVWDDELWTPDRLVASCTLPVSAMNSMKVVSVRVPMRPAGRFAKQAKKASAKQKSAPGVFGQCMQLNARKPPSFDKTMLRAEILYVQFDGGQRHRLGESADTASGSGSNGSEDGSTRPAPPAAADESAALDIETTTLSQPDAETGAEGRPRNHSLRLPPGWSLPPSGVLTVNITRCESLMLGVAARHPYIKIEVGDLQRRLPMGEPVSKTAASGSFEWADSVEIIGVDPVETPELRVRVLSRQSLLKSVPVFGHLPAFRTEFSLGEVTIDLGRHAAAAAASGVSTWKIADTYKLRGVKRGSLEAKVVFSRSEEVAALRRRTRRELFGQKSERPPTR